MTIIEASRRLGVTEATIRRWLREGKLPSMHLDGELRIPEEALEALAKVHGLVPASRPSRPQETPLAEALAAGGLYLGLRASDKEEALRKAIRIAPWPEWVDIDAFEAGVLARERLCSTAVGDGIAIPHERALLSVAEAPSVVRLATFDPPIEFGALDGKPVHALFLPLAPHPAVHLHMLARIAHAIREPRIRERLPRSRDPEELLDLFRTLH